MTTPSLQAFDNKRVICTRLSRKDLRTFFGLGGFLSYHHVNSSVGVGGISFAVHPVTPPRVAAGFAGSVSAAKGGSGTFEEPRDSMGVSRKSFARMGGWRTLFLFFLLRDEKLSKRQMCATRQEEVRRASCAVWSTCLMITAEVLAWTA